MPKKEEGPRRSTMEEIVPTHIKMFGSRWIMSRDQLEIFNFPRLFTGIIDVDLILRPTIGKRLGIIGERSVGKTVLTHILEGAAMRTCRRCLTPIIPWGNDDTAEIKEACRCRKNDGMVVAHIDAEDSFDPLWAQRWGPPVDPEAIQRKGYKLYKGKSEKFWAVLPLEGDAAFDFIDDAVRNGALDFVVIDSIAVLMPKENLEAKGEQVGISRERISPRARLLSRGLPKVLNAQIKSKLTYGGRATLVWTNQYYMGPTRNPKQDPRRASGGLKAAYLADQEMKIVSAKPEGGAGEGIGKSTRFLDVKFKTEKSKSAGTAGGFGAYRLVLDEMKTRYGMLTAGDTDEPERLKTYLQQLGLFKDTADHFECLGRKFTKVADLRSFLARRDIQFIARYFIFRELLPVTAMDYLKEKDYDYSPFGPDKAFSLCRLEGQGPPDQVDPPRKTKGDRGKSAETDPFSGGEEQAE